VSNVKYLPDYARLPDDVGVTLQKVGIRNVYVDRRWNGEKVVTRQSAYVSLKDLKGIHMSRLAGTLIAWEDEEIGTDDELLEELSATHDGSNAYWKCRWEDKWVGVDGSRFMVPLTLEGKLVDGTTRWYLTFTVPYASVCPCSAEMCNTVRAGIPHMQRSRVTVTVRIHDTAVSSSQSLPWAVSAIIADVCDVVKLLPVPVMKREDELRWCQQAEEHKMFVEDVARQVAKVAESWNWIDDWVIVAEHEESIHEHNAVAVVWKGVELR